MILRIRIDGVTLHCVQGDTVNSSQGTHEYTGAKILHDPRIQADPRNSNIGVDRLGEIR